MSVASVANGGAGPDLPAIGVAHWSPGKFAWKPPRQVEQEAGKDDGLPQWLWDLGRDPGPVDEISVELSGKPPAYKVEINQEVHTVSQEVLGLSFSQEALGSQAVDQSRRCVFKKGELEACHSLDEIRQLVARNPGPRNAIWSWLLFRQLLHARVPPVELQEFLEDASINHVDAYNVVRMVKYFLRSAATTAQLDSIGPLIESGVRLGSLPLPGIRTILEIFLAGQSQANGIPWSICEHIWRGMVAAEVLKLQDLDARMVKTLLQVALRAPLVNDGLAMATALLGATPLSMLRHITPTMVGFLIEVYSTPQRQAESDVDMAKPLRQSLVSFLQSLPPSMAQVFITQTTSSLLGHTVELARNIRMPRAQEQLRILNTWLTDLGHTNLIPHAKMDSQVGDTWLEVEEVLINLYCNRVSSRPLVRYLACLSQESRHQLIAGRWLERRLQAYDAVKPAIPESGRPLEPVLRPPEALDSPFAGLKSTIDVVSRQAPLYLQNYLCELIGLLQDLDELPAIQNIFAHLKRQRLPFPYPAAGRLINRYAFGRDSMNLMKAIDFLLSHSALRLENYPDLILAIVKSPHFLPRTVLDLLEHNDSQARRKRTVHLTPRCAAVYHIVALQLAREPRLSPRHAFRNTWKVYQVFRGQGQLLDRRMSQALVHASVVRYIEAGHLVARERLKTVLDVVASLEGRAVAEKIDRLVSRWNQQRKVVAFAHGQRSRIARTDRCPTPAERAHWLAVWGKIQAAQRMDEHREKGLIVEMAPSDEDDLPRHLSKQKDADTLWYQLDRSSMEKKLESESTER